MRIALIHALTQSVDPINEAFARLWPEAKLSNILDDSLSRDLAEAGTLTPAIFQRFLDLTRYAVSVGHDGILFTCSAFGPCIEACCRTYPGLPILKPNEAVIEEALALWQKSGKTDYRIGLLATFAPTLASMPDEFKQLNPDTQLSPCLATGALNALAQGNPAEHDRIAAESAKALQDCDLIVLSQFSLARAAAAVTEATGKPVLTTPDSAVNKLKRLLLASVS